MKTPLLSMLCVLTIGFGSANAAITLSVEDLVTSDTGAEFTIAATNQGDDAAQIGVYSLQMQLDNFLGSDLPETVGFDVTNLIPSMMETAFGTTPHPGTLPSGGVFAYTAFGPATVTNTRTDLAKVELIVPGGLAEPAQKSLSFTVVPFDPADPLGSISAVGDEELIYPPTLVIGQFESPFADCDVNQDGTCDANDIDDLGNAIRQGGSLVRYDLNQDNVLDDEDRRFWVNELMHTYFGDSNLDGEFNTTDLIDVFQIGQFEDGIARNSGWASGDWSGDLDFDTSDFVVAFKEGGYGQPPRAATSAVAVPEPASLATLIAGGLCWYAARRRAS